MPLAYEEYYTLDDYRRWEGDWELIGGMPYAMTPSPSVTHQICAANLLTQIKINLDSHPESCDNCHVLMATDWEVSSDTVVRPDILVTCDDLGEKVIKTPGLIAEVISASSAKRDEQQKFELYRKEGVVYYILVYPHNQLAKIYRNKSSEFRKIGDMSDESLEFEFGECKFTLDFGKVWR